MHVTFYQCFDRWSGADHLTLEERGGWVISGQQDFFSSNLVGRIFVSLLNALIGG